MYVLTAWPLKGSLWLLFEEETSEGSRPGAGTALRGLWGVQAEGVTVSGQSSGGLYGGKKWSDYGHILKVESTKSPVRLYVMWKEEVREGGLRAFTLSKFTKRQKEYGKSHLRVSQKFPF